MNTNYRSPIIIAEIGCNHKGDFEIAKELIVLAKDAGANVAKFQKRNNIELLSREQYNSPHPNPKNAYGKTYGEHREFLEFTKEQHRQLSDFCRLHNIVYSSSVWDCTSAEEIIEINPKLIKVPSGCNTNFNLLEILRDKYCGEIHISLGMTTHCELDQIIHFFKQKNKLDSLVLYACTSGYPISYQEACLLEIKRIKDNYAKDILDIGFSGHHLGINLDMSAYTLGARYIERHFTKDKTWKGTDHSASLEPSELSYLTKGLNEVYEALNYKDKELLDIELPQRKKLKYGCY